MTVRSSQSSRAPSLVPSSTPALSKPGAPPAWGVTSRLLPGRRRLVRQEDSSGTDSDGEEGDLVVPSSSVSYLAVSGSKRPAPGGQCETSFAPSRKVRASYPLPVLAPSDSGIASNSDSSDSDVIYVRTERASLSQTFLTSWLVRKA